MLAWGGGRVSHFFATRWKPTSRSVLTRDCLDDFATFSRFICQCFKTRAAAEPELRKLAYSAYLQRIVCMMETLQDCAADDGQVPCNVSGGCGLPLLNITSNVSISISGRPAARLLLPRFLNKTHPCLRNASRFLDCFWQCSTASTPLWTSPSSNSPSGMYCLVC